MEKLIHIQKQENETEAYFLAKVYGIQNGIRLAFGFIGQKVDVSMTELESPPMAIQIRVYAPDPTPNINSVKVPFLDLSDIDEPEKKEELKKIGSKQNEESCYFCSHSKHSHVDGQDCGVEVTLGGYCSCSKFVSAKEVCKRCNHFRSFHENGLGECSGSCPCGAFKSEI